MTKVTYLSTSRHPLATEAGVTLSLGERHTIDGEPTGTDATAIAQGRLIVDDAPKPSPKPKTTASAGEEA